MRLSKKKAILLSVVFVIGIAISFFALVFFGFNFKSLTFDKYEEKTYEITEDFKNITVNATTADISFYKAEDGKCKVVCDQSEKVTYTVLVNNDTLNISLQDGRKWYDNLRLMGFGAKKISVYLPDTEYSALNIEMSTGDININGIKAVGATLTVSTGNITLKDVVIMGDLSVTVSTGNVVLDNINCKNLSSNGSTGNITLNNVIAAEKMNIERSTGDITFIKSDAGEIIVKTSTGDVTGTLLTDKVFIIDTSTGRKSVPESIVGGKCKITTTTGDIEISIG